MSNAEQIWRATSESCEMLLRLLETFPGALFFIDGTETIIYANVSAQTMIGAPLEALYGCSFWRGVPQLVSTALYQAVLTSKRTKEPTEVEYMSPVTHKWLHVQLAPTVEGLALHFHEKSEAPRNRETFVPDHHPAADVLENLYVGIGCLTPEGILLEINEAPLTDAQVSREDVIGHPFVDTPWWSFYPESQEQLRAAILRASMGETVRFETLVHPREGMDLYLEATITPHRDAEHQVVYLVYVGTDITERKRSEGAIQALVDALPQLVWIARPDGYVTYNNSRLITYLAMTHEQAEGVGWMAGLHPDDLHRVKEVWQAAIQTGEPYEVEHRVRDGSSGAYRWFLIRGVPQRSAQGTILHWVGTCTDIEDQKRIEEALRQSQERIRALIDSNIIGIISVEVEGEVIVEANDAWLRMTGYTRDEVRGRMLNRAKVTPPEQAPLFEHAIQEIATRGQHTPFEHELVCKDGSRLPALTGGVIFQEVPRQMVVFTLDNSARQELEQRKDAFISIASHELRNPLTALKLQTSLLHRQLTRQGISAAPALSNMEIQIKKVNRLVEELLDVSKIQAGRLEYVQEPIDFDELLGEIVGTLQQSSPSHTLVVRGATRTRLLGDRDRLGQVFTNLISNAIKYSPGTESVEIDLSAAEDTLTVHVHDHGMGIPRELRDKIFDRFYRVTDPKRQAIPGLGMGLYIVAEIIKHHGGKIAVESEVGKGSTFTVILPRTCKACVEKSDTRNSL